MQNGKNAMAVNVDEIVKTDGTAKTNGLKRFSALRPSYLLVVAICTIPLIPGFLAVLLASFSYVPPVGLHHFSFHGYQQVITWHGLAGSILLTVSSTLISTYLALLLCFSILQGIYHRKIWQRIEALIAPLLAMPHVAFAIGFAFLFAPTGMIARLFQHWFSIDLSHKSWFSLVQDPHAIGLTLVLALKETPFLILMSIPIIQQLNVTKLAQVSQSMGYSINQLWWKVVLPQWLPKMRFALFSVLAYGVSVVDLSVIMGPNRPPTLAALVWQWFNDANLSHIPRAAAGAMLLFAIASLILLFAVFIEKLSVHFCHRWQYSGRYGLPLPGKTALAFITLLTTVLFPLMLIWSFALRWRFPNIWPSHLSSRFWQQEWPNLWPTIGSSVMLALCCATCALLLALIAHEYRAKYRWHLPNYVIALPMLIPQLSVLLGIQITSLFLASNQYFLWVLWAHIFFAFPYVYLSMDGPWRSYNNHYSHTALSLGKSPLSTLLRVKLPILRPAVAYAWAIGASVSLAQYLPTLMLGGGRISTITTEAVALSSGFDRRITAIYALWQAALPFVFFAIAILVGKSRWSSKTLMHRSSKQA